MQFHQVKEQTLMEEKAYQLMVLKKDIHTIEQAGEVQPLDLEALGDTLSVNCKPDDNDVGKRNYLA